MKDIIMLVSSVLFGMLFVFLVFIFSVFVVSRFFRHKIKKFEPNVSVVIPAYNEEKNIEECVDSVFNSDYPKEKMEIIVVDDGSKDKTLRLLKKYKKIKILRQNNLRS